MHYAEKKKQERKKSVKRRQHQEHHKATHWSAFGKKKIRRLITSPRRVELKYFSFTEMQTNECARHTDGDDVSSRYTAAHTEIQSAMGARSTCDRLQMNNQHTVKARWILLFLSAERAREGKTQTQKTGFAVLNSTVFCAFCSLFCFSAFTVHSHSSEYAFRFDIYTAKECSMSVWNLYISRRNEDGRWELNASEKEKMANKKKSTEEEKRK